MIDGLQVTDGHMRKQTFVSSASMAVGPRMTMSRLEHYPHHHPDPSAIDSRIVVRARRWLPLALHRPAGGSSDMLAVGSR
jgi:hypothetical protein